MNVIQKNDKFYVETNYTTGNKAHFARISGLDPKWGLKREFLNSTRKGLKLDEVKEGEFFEESISSHSGKNTDRYYYVFKAGAFERITEKDLKLSFL